MINSGFNEGLRGSITRSQLNFENSVPIRVKANSFPAIVNGKIVRDRFRSNSKFSQQYQPAYLDGCHEVRFSSNPNWSIRRKEAF